MSKENYQNERIISPRTRNILFSMNEPDCYRKQFGRCSLDVNEEDAQVSKYPNVSCGKYSYCRKLLESLSRTQNLGLNEYNQLHRENDGIRPVYITERHDGNCTITDGNHRLCIAQRKNLKVWACIDDSKKI